LHFSLAFALRKLRDYERAALHLKEALQINPRFAKAVLFQGIVWYEMGRREDGIRRIEESLTLDTGFDRARFEQALEHDRAGRIDQAIALFETLSSNSTDDALYHAQMGDDLYRRGDFAAAVAEYRKALAIRPNFADIRNHLGMALAALGKEEEAIEQFQHALEINPRYLEARLNLAITLRDMGRAEEAREQFRIALDIDPENAVARNALSDLAA
jgi:tetratricopeptide (TPR) repeat protein